MKKIINRKTDALNYNLTRIEWNLLNYYKCSDQQLYEDVQYLDWAKKFNRIDRETYDYFCQLVLYSLGKLSVDEEIELMESVVTKSWTLSHNLVH